MEVADRGDLVPEPRLHFHSCPARTLEQGHCVSSPQDLRLEHDPVQAPQEWGESLKDDGEKPVRLNHALRWSGRRPGRYATDTAWSARLTRSARISSRNGAPSRPCAGDRRGIP